LSEVKSLLRRRVRLAVWLAAHACASSACSSHSAATTLDTVELASGEYSNLQWGGTQVERFHVLARPMANPSAAVLVSPQHAEPCSLGDSVARFRPFQPRSGGKYVLGAPSPARIVVFDTLDQNGFGTMSFADIACKRTDLQIDNASSGGLRPLYTPDLSGVSIADVTSDATLLLIDPWANAQLTVAHDVSALQATDTAAWLVEDHQVVKRDLQGNELFRRGSNVSELDLLGPDNDIAYVDDRGLSTLRQGKEKTLAADGCGLRTLDGFIPGALAYYAPCTANQLVIATPDGKTLDFGKTVDDDYNAQEGRLLFTTHSDADSTLWVVHAAEPMQAEVLLALPGMNLQSFFTLRAGVLMLQVKQPDNTLSLLQLALDHPEDGTTVAADNVISYGTAQGAIAIGTSDGALILRNSDSGAVLARAASVGHWTFVFNDKSSALAYISDADPQTKLGRLQLHFLSGDHFVIADEVREFGEVWWPERGILYAASGAKPGIRFTAVDVPCEATSDTAWACGF
jgi:hypothetical protein